MDSLVDSTLYLIFNFSRRNGTPVFMDMVNQPLSFYTNLVLAAIVLNYIIAVSRYHWIHRTQGEGQLPPAYPSFLPLIGNLILLLWDNEQLFRRLT
jgi:hypothetical protein